MIVGEHNRDNYLDVNVTREWINEDEFIEVTPDTIRIRKKILEANKRK
jgi:GTP-binding protein